MALTRRALGGITIGGSAALALSACSDDEGGSGNAEVVWAIANPWEAWCETTSTGNNSSGHQAMTPMIPMGGVGYDFTPDGDVVYDDAIFDGAPQLVSEEPMALQYTLNPDAQWSDGKPVRVEDFIFHWHALSGNPEHANQDLAIPASIDWGSNVASIEEQEDGTILVTYIDGYIDPEWAFTGGVYLPSHYAEENGFEDWQNDPDVMGEAIKWFNENLWTVVTGAYKPKTLEDGKPDAKMGEYIKYEINENYQGSVKPTIQNLTITMVQTLESEVTELRQGTIAGCWPNEFFTEEFDKLDEQEELTYEFFPGSQWTHLDFNLNNEFLSDVALRQALYTAVDLADIAEKSYPGTEVSMRGSHFFKREAPDFVDYMGELTKQGTGDLEEARRILEEAGYTWNGEEKLLTPDGAQVAFNFRYGQDSELSTLTADLLQAYWAEIGVDLELVSYAAADFTTVLTGSEFDLISFVWSGDPAFTVGPGQFFQSESGSNFGSYSDPEVDEAIPMVRSTFDLAEAAGYANAVGELVAPLAWTLPMFDRPQSVIYNTNLITGPGPNGNSQSGPLYNVREWTHA
ncbi:ABC transporter substrate-binding protein [Glycomyces buryatensis]|uniref:Solute-binding protein family 5 domain-containing protein n=1 Tax=Glycomyces buryatensis TaxID=2570927 RepID=A0A4S8QD89_9ACTN|nr:ABC transporter substrate-binding protein [Glycomyces buryatensis]THV42270.1 hypothetical protein FAB82_06305 [Glycomyces buryatensis]